MSEFTALENAVLQAIRAGQEPDDLRKEFEAILSDGWTLKLRLDQQYADRVIAQGSTQSDETERL